MPTYNVTVKPNTFSPEQKSKIAKAITKKHHELTGAPEFYVQVIIDEVPGRARFVSGYPCDKQTWICGYIRSGRNEEQRGELMRAIVKEVAEAAEIDSNTIWFDLVIIDPTNILKYNQVFPPAGGEAEWLESLPTEAKAIIEELKAGTWDKE